MKLLEKKEKSNCISYSVNIPTDKRYWEGLDIFRIIWHALFSKPLQKEILLDGEKVKKYFQSYSPESMFDGFTDSSTKWYIDILEKSKFLQKQLNRESQLKILDLGCGRGGLYQWITSNRPSAFSYTGVDFNDVAINRCIKIFDSQNTQFAVQDVNEPLGVFDEAYDLVFCINVFPYINDISSVTANMVNACSSENGLIIVVDPVPSFYWETECGDFSIHIREPEELRKVISAAGLKILECGHLNSFSLLGMSFLPIASATIMKKTDETIC